MKKIFFPLILSLLFISSCDEDSPLSSLIQNKVTAKINGTSFESVGAGGSFTSIFGTTQEDIFITSTQIGNPVISELSFGLVKESGPTPTAGTYTKNGTNPCSPELICSGLSYKTESDKTGRSSLEGGFCEIVFTTLEFQAGGRVTGTFSGVMVSDDDPTVKFEVTEGSFEVDMDF